MTNSTTSGLDPAAVAAAFSEHRFADTFEAIAPDARWVLVGEAEIEGREAIVAACESSAAELATTSTVFRRFVTVAGATTAAVDAVGVYTDAAGAVTTVSSCDVYEFRDGLLSRITSYAVELED